MSSFFQWIVDAASTNMKLFATAVGICAIFWLIEMLRPSTTDIGMKGRLHNLASYALLLFGLALCTPLIVFANSLLPAVSLIDRIASDWRSQGLLGGVLATLIYAVVWDFFQYWAHRLEHKLPALWIFHRTHHSDTHMNSSTSLRQSLGGAMLGFFLTSIPAAIVCGGGMLPYLGSLILFSGWGYFNHANVRLSLGPLGLLLSGPQWHRIHHGVNPEYHNCNYAAFFPVYDLLFGTLRLPQKDEWVQTGIENDQSCRSTFKQVFLPWLNSRQVDR